MKFLILTIAVAVLGVSAGELPEDFVLRDRAARITANANNYFDAVVKNIQQYAVSAGLDPLQIPDIHEKFSVQGVIIEWQGALDLTQGYLKDISTLNRKGDVIANYENKVLTLTATIGFGDLQFFYDFYAEIMDIGPTGTVDGTVTDLELYVVIEVDLNALNVSLQTFEIDHTGSLHVEVHGNGLLDIIADAIIDIATGVFKDVIMNVVQDEVKKVLEDALSQIDLGSII